jgi:CRISPR-associated protein Cas2
MRVLVMFDMPTKTKQDKKNYREFRKYLIKNGFDMLQFSVYSKLVKNNNQAKKTVADINNYLPVKGLVRVLIVTEKQYNSMYILLGEPRASEYLLTTEDIIEL